MLHSKSYKVSINVETITVTTKSRNHAIDLLRIIAMFMVCMIHINLFTKAYDEAAIIPGKEYFFTVGLWTETVGYIGVNVYALITGYVCLHSKWRLSRYLELWGQVAFYTIGLLVVGLLLSHFGILPWDITKKYIAKILLRLPAGNTYWYFAAYSALFLIIPFINKLLLSLRQREHLLLLGALMLVLPCVNILQPNNVYLSGYNATWLAALYAAGAYIKRFPPHISPWITGAVALLCTLQPLLCWMLHLPRILSYCSPVMVIYSLCLFLFVYKWPINSTFFRKLIMWAAPVSFGVYLIHVHPWCWAMLKRYVPALNEYLDYPWWIAIVGGAILYLICAVVDWLRSLLFHLCRVRKLADCVGSFIETSVTKILNRILPENEKNS